MNNMVHIAATAHHAELHQAANRPQLRPDHSGATSPSSSRVARALWQQVHTWAARPARSRTAIPRISI